MNTDKCSIIRYYITSIVTYFYCLIKTKTTSIYQRVIISI